MFQGNNRGNSRENSHEINVGVMVVKTKLYASLAVAVAVIVAAWFVSDAWKRTHPVTERIIVTGMAQTDFVSDLIVWRGWFTRQAATTKEAYPRMKDDAALVAKYLKDRGIPEGNVVFSAVEIEPQYKNVRISGTDGYDRQFDGYRLSQSVQIESKEVDKVELVSREISELINAGVELNSSHPEFYYTKLSELKIDLLAKAAKDGRERAEAISSNSGGRLGPILKADMGIFQITAQNSNEDYSWGGTFNTSAKNKTALITVKMEFATR